MERYIDRGLPFVVGDLWQAPHFPEDSDLRASSVFPPLDTTCRPLQATAADESSHFDFTLDLPGHIPELHPLEDAHLEQPELQSPTAQSPIEQDVEFDPWKIDEAWSAKPALCTWESFDGKDVRNSQTTAFLSESGISAFDTAANLRTNRDAVLPQDFVLRAMGNLAVGRPSSLYQWNASKQTFEPVMSAASTSGLTRTCSDSVTREILELGNTVRRLKDFRDMPRSAAGHFPALQALKRCVSLVLDAVDQSISAGLSNVRTIPNLQHLVRQPQALLVLLARLVDISKPCTTEEELISSVSDHVWSFVHVGHAFHAIIRRLLAKISAPWLERLSVDLGLCDPIQSLNDACVDHATDSNDKQHVHGFLDESDQELIFETKAAVSLLREIAPSHPLLGSSAADFVPHYATFAKPASKTDLEISGAFCYESSMLREMAQPTGLCSSRIARCPHEMTRPRSKAQDCWLGDALSNGNMDDYAALMSRDLTPAAEDQTHDELTEDVLRACRPTANHDGANACSSAIRSSHGLIDRVRPLIMTQNRMVNGVLLRQLLRDYNLRRHLEAQRAFQLFGSGDFLDRLSTALFRPDVQSAERKRGVIPTGEVMGLRLGTSPEQRWPPASSELRLTLANVLQDSQHPRQSNSSSRNGARRLVTIPISFAVRELPEEEIDRVLAVQSVHALDFLRLQYDAAAPIDTILDSDSLVAYDNIFRFLLKLLRQIYVTTNLPRNSFTKCSVRGLATRLAQRSHHFVSVLLAHVMDLGIDVPWRAFMLAIDQLEQSLVEEDAAGEIGTKTSISITGLRALHKSFLECIRGRLYLMKKHQKVRLAMEDVFAAVLRCGAMLTASGELDAAAVEQECSAFDQSCSRFLDVLQLSIEKSSRSLSALDSGDAEFSRLLLLKLRERGDV